MAKTTRTLKVYMAHDRVNGKCYIGSTVQSLEKRKRAHYYDATRNKKLKGKTNHFQSALLLRPDKFFWMVLEEIEIEVENSTTSAELRKKEKEWINKFWGQDWLYNDKNSATGFGCGESNPNHTQEWKDMMSKKLSGENNPMAGGHTQETIDKISKALKGKPKPDSMKQKMRGPSNNRYGTLPWDTLTCKDKTVWINADKIYDYWNKTKHGSLRISKHFSELGMGQYAYGGILSKFKKGWIPQKDENWLNFVKDIV